MADSRNDTISSSRLPTDGENKYVISIADSSDGRVGSPMNATSPVSNTGSPRQKLMTESEITDLVHDALMRARKATKTFSPIRRTMRSVNSDSTPTRNNLPEFSATTTPSDLDRPLVHSRSPNSCPTNTRLAAELISTSPSSKKISVPSLETPSISEQSENQEQSIVPNPSLTSVESAHTSDDVIRRVEEEIANARRAAKEATRRLAGVSARYLEEAQLSNPKIPKNLRVTKPEQEFVRVSKSDEQSVRVSNLDEQLVEMMATTTNGSASTDEDGQFDSALDLIGEEFDEIVSGTADQTEFTEEKKEEEREFENHSATLIRNQSIEQCERESLQGDEPNNSNNGIQADNSSEITTDVSNESQADINVIPSFDEFPHLYELEAVLSDEREMDRLAMEGAKAKTEWSQDDQDDSIEPEVDIEIASSDEPENPSFHTNTSLDQVEEAESTEPAIDDEFQKVEEKESTSDERSFTPEASISASKDTATSVNIPYFEPSGVDLEDESPSWDEAKIESSITDIVESKTEIIDNKNPLGKTSNESSAVREDYHMFALNESKDESKIESSISDIVESKTEITDNKKNPFGTPSTKSSAVGDENRFKDDDDMFTLNESKDESKIESSIADIVENKTEIIENKKSPLGTTSSESSAVRDENWFKDDDASKIESVITDMVDDKTKIAENTKSPLNEQVLDDFLKTQHSEEQSPSKLPTVSRTKDPSFFNFNKVSDGTTKVTFKQRYPVPQKIKPFREPSEIIRDNKEEENEKATKALWLSMPKAELKELLDSATGASIQRRSNACGALKVLSTQKKNALMLVRTKGFMDAVVFAMSDNYSIEDMEAGSATRARAVNVILNVSTKKDNRYHVLMHPGLSESLLKCMIEDNGEARELACAAFATLAKSSFCREPMGKIENLVDTLANILRRDANSVIANLEEKESDYSVDDELSHDHSGSTGDSASDSAGDSASESYPSSSASSSLTRSTYASRSVDSQKEDPEARQRTRMNACAVLMHLSKECSVSQELCASDALLSSLISCCREVDSPLHTKCLEILANLTRFPHNNARLTLFPHLVETVLYCGNLDDDEDRLWSMRIFQNLSSESFAKVQLATGPILELLSTNMMAKQYEEQLAATSCMYNISTEPAAVVSLTNTKNVVATLVHVAHSPASMMEVRTIACDALSTLGLWLQTLSSSGTVPEGVKPVSLPSYITSGWQRWEE